MTERISFKEFQKLDIRVGTVTDFKDHPNADKLVLLQVDLGDETRQLVAGIKGHYTKEELVGKQIVVLCNLEPAMLRGEKSDGMLLAADDEKEGIISLLRPEKPVKNGTKVR
ncbi:MAG: methionine--tRNA ligase subunit beta [Candidatus Aenigmarchaeota archaeon ex4484_14]|nr:MAG: methionine--tRNA ligase subunit beta [Candidatus Aenigmarchaeota archaeon ex4484_14]